MSEIGIKVYLKKVKFGDQKDDNLEYHLHVESQMLKMYAELLIEMLTNKMCAGDYLSKMEIDPELKCILYECLRAEEKTKKQEQDSYDAEIQKHIQADQMKKGAIQRKGGAVSQMLLPDDKTSTE